MDVKKNKNGKNRRGVSCDVIVAVQYSKCENRTLIKRTLPYFELTQKVVRQD
jgi:hypothetical protein